MHLQQGIDLYAFGDYADHMTATKTAIITALSLLIVATAGIAAFGLSHHTAQNTASQVVVSQPQPPTVNELLTLVNAERAKVGVAPLIEDSKLDVSAQLKADDMNNNHYYSHVDASGKHGYMYAYEAEPIKCNSPSENLDYAPTLYTSKEAVAAWMNSTAHREALLSPQYTITGFGVAGLYTVEHFC